MSEPLINTIPLETLARLVAAVLAAGTIGWERERQNKPAGLRTHMLVSLGSAAFVVTVVHLVESMDPPVHIRLDPLRVVSGIVGGVGFLGAGSIIQSRGSVEGITTAASVWVAAAIGTAAGFGMYWIVLYVALLTLAILIVVGVLEHRRAEKHD